MHRKTQISTGGRIASVAMVSLFAIAISIAIAEARGGHGGGGGAHAGVGGGGAHVGGGGARAFSGGGGARAFSGGGGARGFSGSRAFSGSGFARGSGSPMVRSAGIPRSFSGFRSSQRFVASRGVGTGRNGRLAGFSTASLNRSLVTGSVRGAGRASLLRNSAFASAGTGRHWALTRGSFQGRFANQRWNSHGGWWWNHHHAIVAIGWFGGLFWPYAYWDFLDYTFWPYAYDAFWPYAYDDFYVGLFGPYAYEGPDYGDRIRYSRRGRVIREPSTTGGAVVCGTQVPALTNWPIEQISKTVEPNDAQQAALAEFKDATGKAIDALKAACPDDLPSTPPGRMAAMHKRVAAMLLAINIVQPPLQRFYESLTDEQKARFNVVNSEEQPARTPRRGNRLVDLSQVCGEQQIKATNVPVDRIVQSLKPTDAQRVALDSLNDATTKAAALLKTNCPKEQSLTPPGRVTLMQERLNTMLEAIKIVEPELDAFYGLLTDEQKARFNQLGAGEG
jgi:LTXXQ motif family protein